MKDYIDKCRDTSQTERIVERWMMRQAERCLERGDEDQTEWFEPKRWESFNRREIYDEEANKMLRDLCRMMGARGESEESQILWIV